jgi:predicted dehydrogenase
MPVQIVMAGCGNIAPLHLDAARHAEAGCRYVGALDADAARAEALAERFGLPRVYANWAEALADPDVEAVDLCLPHHLHQPYAVEALAAGKHVLVEKPLAVSVAEADTMIEAARRAGRVLMPVHNWLYVEPTLRAREVIAGGALGEVYLVEVVGIQDPATVAVRPWLERRGEAGGGVAIAQTIHFLYLARYLLGEVRRVAAFTSNKGLAAMQGEATLAMSLEFADGTLGSVTSTFAQGPGSGELRLTVYGTRGLLHDTVSAVDVVAPALFGDEDLHTVATADPGDPLGFTALLGDFSRAVQEGVAPRVTALDGRAALAIVEAAYTAAQRGASTSPVP